MGNTRKTPANFHGTKGKSGRKPSAVTIAKRRLIENKIDEAEASFAFLVEIRDNSKESTRERVAAAIWIYETVFGKAKQPIELSWREEAKKLGYDPDAIIHQAATAIAEVGMGRGDAGSVDPITETASTGQQ